MAGDYPLQFGQGLVLGAGFAPEKGAEPSPPPGGRTLVQALIPQLLKALILKELGQKLS